MQHVVDQLPEKRSTRNKLTERLAFLKKNDLFGRSVSNLTLQIGGMGLSYVAVYLISKVYNADILGYYTLSNVVLQIASMIVLFGVNTATVQMVPGLYAAQKSDSVSSLALKGLLHTLIVGLIGSLALYFSAGFIATNIMHKPNLAAAYQIVSIGVIPLSVLTLLSDFLRGCGKNVLWAIVTRVLTPGIFILLFAFGYYVSGKPEPVFLNTMAYVATFGLTLVFFLVFVRKNHLSLSFSNLKVDPSYKELRRISFPMFLFSSNVLLGGWISTLMVGVYGTTADTGVYRVIDRISSLCTLVLIAVNAVLAPKIAAAYSRKDMESMKKNVKFATKLNFWLSLPIPLALVLFNKPILGLFGAEFVRGSGALLIILIGYIVNSLTGPCGQVLNMTNHQVFLRNISFIGLLISIALNYLLIPRYGLPGAAFASMSNTVFVNIFSVIKIRKEFKFNTYYIPLLRTLDK